MKVPFLCTALAIVLIGQSFGLSAQEAGSGPAEEIGEVIVTASRIGEDPKDSAASVTVIDSEDIAKSGENSLAELLERVAGVSFRYLGGVAMAEVSMRGFGENSFGRVVVLVNGKRLNNPDMKGIDWLSVPLADIQRIEVLHGPSGTLYGNGAIGGVINIITKKASKPLETATSVGVASDWTNRESARVAVSNELFGLTFSAEHYGTEGYRDRSGAQSANGGLSAEFYPVDTVTIALGASIADIAYELPGSLTKQQAEDDPRQSTNPQDGTREHGIATKLGLSWEPSEAFSLTVPFDLGFENSDTDYVSYSSFLSRRLDAFESRPQATGTLDLGGPKLRITGGADIRHLSLTNTTYADVQRSDDGDASVYHQTNIAPFAELRLAVANELSFEAGARYDTVANVGQGTTVNYSAFVYDFGVNVRPVEQFHAFARFGSLFRYPFTDELFQFGGPALDLRPETGVNAEVGAGLGIKKLLSLDFTGYYMALTDEIAYDPTLFSNVNFDPTTRFGLEVSFCVTPAEFIELSADYAFVDARFASGDNAGKSIPLVPQHDLKAGLALSLPFGLSFGPSIRYVGESFAGGDVANTGDKVSEYFLLDASLRFVTVLNQGTLSLLATAENLLDLAYIPLVYSYGNYPAPGRSFSFAVSYRY